MSQEQIDLAKILHQEELLVFPKFDETDAYSIGSIIHDRAVSEGWSVVIDIRQGDDIWFMHAMPGTTQENFDWTRRKRNLVNKTHNCSYAGNLRAVLGLVDPEQEGWDKTNFAPAGGCFPVRVSGQGLVGTVTVSGIPQRDDHRLVSESIAKHLGVELGEHNLA
jgi:uncharacterized protein (UPF0303 family)